MKSARGCSCTTSSVDNFSNKCVVSVYAQRRQGVCGNKDDIENTPFLSTLSARIYCVGDLDLSQGALPKKKLCRFREHTKGTEGQSNRQSARFVVII